MKIGGLQKLSTVNYQLPIPNSQLPITNYQLPITNYQFPIPNSQLSTVNCQLFPTFLASGANNFVSSASYFPSFY
ncbi:MAG: hypothetical protein HC849_19035 [Oscillatoriales cyanobacterium RU_3_3]|nr:hypothetical protein [Oscillatoriales cyanobacterium RU_3_3]